MPRTARAALGGVVYHVLNRGNGRATIFRKQGDYRSFCQLLVEGRQHANIDVFGFCIMPNHWHLVLRPRGDRDLAAYLSWVTNTHVKRYRAHHPDTSGHLYQGRYNSFPVEQDTYFLALMRYVEANPIRCTPPLASRAKRWAWSSLGCDDDLKRELTAPWPMDRPGNWTARVNEKLPESKTAQIHRSLKRGTPLGSEKWTTTTVVHMGLQFTLNPRGRPRLKKPEEK